MSDVSRLLGITDRLVDNLDTSMYGGVLEYPKGLGAVNAAGVANMAIPDAEIISYVHFSFFEPRAWDDRNNKMRDVFLYMPENLQNPTSVSWDTQAFHSFGAFMDTNANGNTYSLGNLDNVASRLLNKGMATAGNYFLNGVGPDNKQDVLTHANKKILNPYLKLLFRGINFRNFEFNFKFMPKNEAECDTIHEIIKTFRKAAHPEHPGAGGGNAGDTSKFMYPWEVEVTYKFEGEDHPFLNKFKRCQITDLHTNYTGQGLYVAMRNGFPADTHLRVQFTETEIITRTDIDEGY